jgi:hypothetical protein
MFLAKYQMLDDVPNKYGQYLQIPGGCKNRLEHARGRERNETLDLVSCHILEPRTPILTGANAGNPGLWVMN